LKSGWANHIELQEAASDTLTLQDARDFRKRKFFKSFRAFGVLSEPA
jgi:hypothetical protein